MRFAILSAVLFVAGAARADEVFGPIETNGEWTAMVHRPSQLAPADMCMAGNAVNGLYFRVDALSNEIRVADRTWSLPKGVAGSVVLSVGKLSMALPITGNSDQMVLAEVAVPDLVKLLDAMDLGSTMTVTVGKERPRQLSLAGSTKVTNAFRVCARLPGNAPGAGNNPFK